MEFKDQLNKIKSYLAERKMLKKLAERANVEVRTVHNAFSANTFDDLKGSRLDVYREAINMVDEIKSLPTMATRAINKQS